MAKELDHLPLLPEIEVGTIIGLVQYNTQNVLYYKVIGFESEDNNPFDFETVKMASLRVSIDDVVFYRPGSYFRYDTVGPGFLRNRLDDGTAVILDQKDWDKLKAQYDLAVAALKARMMQTIEAARKKPTPSNG